MYNWATDNGLNPFSSCPNPPPKPSPDTSFDAAGVLAAVQSGARDGRGGAQDLYDHGYYAEGDQAMALWRSQLATSPVGIAVQAIFGQASNNPAALTATANALSQAASDPVVRATWASHGWGDPHATIDGVVQDMKSHAMAILKARAKATAPTKATSPTMSTATKVGALAAGAAAASIGVYAWLHHMAYKQAASIVWKNTGGRMFRALKNKGSTR
jgi:hypothetical protein